MPIAERPEEIPEGAVDVTQDVLELKEQLRQLFQGKDISIVGMSLGTLIGETFDDPEIIKGLLTMISDVAGNLFVATHMTLPEGASIQ